MPSLVDFRKGFGGVIAITTLTVSTLLTISSGANLNFAGGFANGVLFLDASKNASSTSRIRTDGDLGVLFANTVSSTLHTGPAGSLSAPTFNFGGNGGDSNTGFTQNQGAGTMSVVLDGSERCYWTYSAPAGGIFRCGNGTSALPSISFDSDTDVGIYNSSTNVLGLAAGGSQIAALQGSSATNTLDLSTFGKSLCIVTRDTGPTKTLRFITMAAGSLTVSTTDCR